MYLIYPNRVHVMELAGGDRIMVSRILMRLGKTPFETFSPWETLEGNYLGGNNGNLVFGYAAHKLLSVGGVEVVPNHYKIHPDMASQVNEEFDAFVLPLANAFRPGFQAELKRTTAFIERLKIPFMMLSGGAQLSFDGSGRELDPIKDDVKKFAKAVLDHSPALSVRGERTAEYLRRLGFRDVVVVGCPSMTLRGPGHMVENPHRLHAGSDIAYNLEVSADFEPSLIEDAERGYRATYFPQDVKTLEGMLWGMDVYGARDRRLPLSRDHAQFQEGRAEYWLDAPGWIDRLSSVEFSFGSRIHGNIAAILAGTPAVVLAHDSRTLELAEYHKIPVRRVSADRESIASVEELVEGCMFDDFNMVHADNFEAMSDFIHTAGFHHIYEDGREGEREDYERRIDALVVSPPVRDLGAVSNSQVAADIGKLKSTEARLLRHVRSLLSKNQRLEQELADVQSAVGELQAFRAEVEMQARMLSERLSGEGRGEARQPAR